MARREGRLPCFKGASFLQSTQDGDGHRHDGRLGVAGSFQIVGGPFEDEGREFLAQGFIGFFKDQTSRSRRRQQLFSHADRLAALTGEQERN